MRTLTTIPASRSTVAPPATFGSAIDGGIEVIVKALRDGKDPDMDAAMEAARQRVDEEANKPDGFLIVAPGANQSQKILIHDQAQLAALTRKAPRCCTQFADIQAACFIDVHGNAAQLFHGFAHARPLVIVEASITEVALINAPDGTDDAHRKP